MPMPRSAPIPPKPKLSRAASVLLAVAGVVVVVLVTVAITLSVHSQSSGDYSTPGAPAEQQVAPAQAEPEAPMPTAKDFTVEMKTTSKQCFGSVGCNVTVEPEISWTADYSDHSCDITYEITGDETGTVIETATTSGDNYDYVPSILSTPSNGTEVTAKITDVYCS